MHLPDKKGFTTFMRTERGFTLVELLVVISIIAILSVIGITIFTSAQKAARDGKRRADIDAIAKALEVNKTSTGYQAVSANWFASGNILMDPKVTDVGQISITGCGNIASNTQNRCYYCFQGAPYPVGYCDTDNSVTLSNTTYFNTNLTQKWILCANLETGSPAYYCRGSQQ